MRFGCVEKYKLICASTEFAGILTNLDFNFM